MDQKLSDIRLEEILDVDVLMDAQKMLSDLLGCSVITADTEGNTVGDMVNFSPFCTLIRSSREGARRCQANGAKLSYESYLHNCAWSHDCHMSLRDCAAPIVVNGKYLGAVLGGQAFVEGEEFKRNQIPVAKLSEELDLPEEKLKEAVMEIPIVSEDYIHSCMECYAFLASYFAQMGIKNQTQKDLLKESNEKLAFQKEAQEAKLKTIEAQINPHFLFNTLNSIARMAMFESAPETEEMIYCLSDFFRYNLSKKEAFPLIKDEIENIKRYLHMQKMRYKDKLTYHIDADKSLKPFRVPSMILQPIVENAIIHGLEPTSKEGTIFIKCIKSKGDIIITVTDNGVGISKERLADILDSMESENSNGIGISNSNGRLKAYFGSSYGLKITSEINKGTKVTIQFPGIKNIPEDFLK